MHAEPMTIRATQVLILSFGLQTKALGLDEWTVKKSTTGATSLSVLFYSLLLHTWGTGFHELKTRVV